MARSSPGLLKAGGTGRAAGDPPPARLADERFVDARTVGHGLEPALGLTVVLLALSAGFFLRANLEAPVQRDGSHFLFMANNIAHGQAPYWASFETKNPLVEYYWAVFIRALRGPLTLVSSARLAEHLWACAGAVLVAVLARRVYREQVDLPPPGTADPVARLFCLSAGLLTLALCLHSVITDDGLNIALYQTLPEAAALLVLLSMVSRPAVSGAVLLGCLLFAGWAVKQTSILSLAGPLILTLYLSAARRRLLIHLSVSVAVAAALVGAFMLSCVLNGTFENYLFSTVRYKQLIASSYSWHLLWQKFVTDLTLWPRAPLFHYHVVILLFSPLAAGLLLFFLFRRRQTPASCLVLAWLVCTIGQALASLLFYRHYFLASIGPAVLSAGVVLLPYRSMRYLLIAALVAFTACLHIHYLNAKTGFAARSRDAPVNQSIGEVRKIIPPGARVFVWGGLLHYHVFAEKPSDYEQNMWWRHIIRGLPVTERDARLTRILAASPPDYVLELYERYPDDNCLDPVRLDPAMLHRWTGRQYILRSEWPERKGRYGCPVRLFALQQGA